MERDRCYSRDEIPLRDSSCSLKMNGHLPKKPTDHTFVILLTREDELTRRSSIPPHWSSGVYTTREFKFLSYKRSEECIRSYIPFTVGVKRAIIKILLYESRKRRPFACIILVICSFKENVSGVLICFFHRKNHFTWVEGLENFKRVMEFYVL